MCKRFLIECYHHDSPSEPTVSILNFVEDLMIEDVGEEKSISIRFDGGTDVCFREDLHHTNLSNGSVVFSSKHDDETYYLISFHEGVMV